MWQSKCFKVPMPREGEMNQADNLETEVQTSHSDAAIDIEVKPEGSAQKRSGLEVELIKELYGISHGSLHGSCQQSIKEAGGRPGASETPPNLPGLCLLQPNIVINLANILDIFIEETTYLKLASTNQDAHNYDVNIIWTVRLKVMSSENNARLHSSKAVVQGHK
ncbi:hypothetical protein OPV22_014751 [Ensete ventricosum]|uniref:Uncharacterized protein n=1 Tax=Ensete ventricosum TaxID=4639 RepID=A0AAV8RBD4_ENSVE|nr:hypothetical protein OPV22_014751 [Ensete ventricosum]